MKEIYLDNAATTRPLQEVAEIVADVMRNVYGNPSSLHKKGIEAETIIKKTSELIARAAGCGADELIYTSGGTESNNTALIGASLAYKRRGNKIITTAIDHPSVNEPFKYLASLGFEICTIAVDKAGYVDFEQLISAVDENTLLVSMMHVNNEIGTIQDIQRAGEQIKLKNKETLFHVDAVQSFGKVPLHIKKSKIDFLSISAHKFYGPRGIGALYKNKLVRMHPFILGGGQQKAIRSGTENVPGIAGMRAACQYVLDHQQMIRENYMACKRKLAEAVLREVPDTFINGPEIEEGAPHILNIGFRDVRAEVLLHALENHGVYVSSGSACASNKKTHSGTLAAIGNASCDLDNAIRFSFGIETTLADIDEVIRVLKEQIMLLRRYTLGGKRP